ncbi:MAG: hypothetical protein NTZ05_07940 [Chloroflexi bacterium]|nr:hypothetical protein [Chloroflexota bacterium]
MVVQHLDFRIVQMTEDGGPTAELWCEDGIWGRIVEIDDALYFELVPRSDGEPWRLSPESVEQILEQARQALQGNDGEAQPSPSDQKEAS